MSKVRVKLTVAEDPYIFNINVTREGCTQRFSFNYVKHPRDFTPFENIFMQTYRPNTLDAGVTEETYGFYAEAANRVVIAIAAHHWYM